MAELEAKTTAIILISGSGERFGHAIPKQFHRLSGKKVYQHTLDTFVQSGLFDQIILVCHPKYIEEVKAENPSTAVVPGGKTRQNSSYLGLKAAIGSDIVVIHDGARPLITAEILKANIEAVKKHKAANTCIPSSDTIVHSTDQTSIDSIPKRAEYQRGQTPQSFAYDLILKAHERSGKADATDDCQLVHALGHPIHIVRGSENNIKITSELDLFLAEQLLRLTKMPTHQTATISLENKIYALTGGTGHIGKAIQKELEAQGAKVIILGRSASHFPVDLRCYDQTAKTFEAIHAQYGQLDGLINSVGKLMVKSVSVLTKCDIEDLITTNLTTLIHSCRLALLKEDASIINIASSSYTRGRKDYAIYSSAKAAVVNFTQGLAEECPKMKVNALVPSRVNSPMRTHNFPDENLSDLLEPTDVAKAVLNLLQSAHLTGSILDVKTKSQSSAES